MKIGVIGFGMVGQSVAAIARGLGARVFVCDSDNTKELVAASEGYFTADLPTMIPQVDVLVTATGKQNVITLKELIDCKNGLILFNVGHDNREINLTGAHIKYELLPDVTLYTGNNREFCLLADGLLLNLAEGSGSAINTFDFCTRACS